MHCSALRVICQREVRVRGPAYAPDKMLVAIRECAYRAAPGDATAGHLHDEPETHRERPKLRHFPALPSVDSDARRLHDLRPRLDVALKLLLQRGGTHFDGLGGVGGKNLPGLRGVGRL